MTYTALDYFMAGVLAGGAVVAFVVILAIQLGARK